MQAGGGEQECKALLTQRSSENSTKREKNKTKSLKQLQGSDPELQERGERAHQQTSICTSALLRTAPGCSHGSVGLHTTCIRGQPVLQLCQQRGSRISAPTALLSFFVSSIGGFCLSALVATP